jgi:hypothetical protein
MKKMILGANMEKLLKHVCLVGSTRTPITETFTPDHRQLPVPFAYRQKL